MIATLGDLVEDITVRLQSTINVASDTQATIRRRRGGSAANTAVAIARLGHPSRFIGQVGDDAAGTTLISALTDVGVDARVRRGGRSGTIVVLIDGAGERSFLTDRGACTSLDQPDQSWLDGVTLLHVPLYSLVGHPLAATTRTVVGWAHERGVPVSVDASSASIIVERGVDQTKVDLRALAPDVLMCNRLEADTLGGIVALNGIARLAAIVKHGADPTVILPTDGRSSEMAVAPIADVIDTTGAGDAFAAGFLVAWSDGADVDAAVRGGHVSARDAIVLASSAI